ncbi:MAG TPA: toll/interleukin-1 receptor domain-containing protein [Steroidobacteraceae bacterium]|jgi:hypothetical protein|nr:toll/interleukin-1 receptor domain-containing protein [Steroidobacteraceae bacterium]
MTHQVFVSYSQPDRDCAFEILERLEGEGIKCWIAPRDITPSADWAAAIMDAISSAQTMVLVFSAASNRSQQVRREVERAVHRELSVLPFRIEDVLPSKSLEFFLSTQHWMDAFPPPREPYYLRLAAYLKAQSIAAPAALDSRPVNTAGARSRHVDDAELQRIERLLAGYIGPVAKYLVRTAAARAADVEDLVHRLATDLESEAERREFTQQCRRYLGST